ncbi:MAG: extracellular solute-binding protein [Verrucomicrobia bacterium]|jgi:molybdate transport system substrate-binding protein|nr:extracellular solute-binding protein [Verrucomicrobiota bacterium]
MKIGFGIVAVVWVMVCGCAKVNPKEGALLCHVGGTMRPALQTLAELYEAETGQAVEINSAGSGELLANIELQAEGDLYVSHDPFLDIIMSRQLADEGWTVAELNPVIIVQKGNPKRIRNLEDLARDDVELALTDYQLSTLGRMLPTIFTKAGMSLDALSENKNIVIHRSGSYVANLVAMQNVDAALVWKAVASLREDSLDCIEITKHLPEPYVDAITSATGKSYKLRPVRVTICSLNCSKQPKAARQFIEFVVSERARKILKEYGFGVSGHLRQEYEKGQHLN